jgi:hypothetical protein
MPVSFQDILFAYEFVAGSDLGEHQAFLCRRTGEIYSHSDLGEVEDEQLPEDVGDEEKYLAIPGKRDLDLGKPLVLDFASECLPDAFDVVRDIFNRKGAYRNFRALLIRRKALERWYAFEAARTEQALREWCEMNEIELAG